ncbi:unannotated protein [freshwater metagenome]|uniref:Unannotated protein n=1 Tax=freshwater metagenome TaxID=449393 RepID=A0A6J6ZAD8_9ZZZZ
MVSQRRDRPVVTECGDDDFRAGHLCDAFAERVGRVVRRRLALDVLHRLQGRAPDLDTPLEVGLEQSLAAEVVLHRDVGDQFALRAEHRTDGAALLVQIATLAAVDENTFPPFAVHECLPQLRVQLRTLLPRLEDARVLTEHLCERPPTGVQRRGVGVDDRWFRSGDDDRFACLVERSVQQCLALDRGHFFGDVLDDADAAPFAICADDR